MTSILRVDNAVYFDNRAMMESDQGGIVTRTLGHKVFKHPSYNLLVGLSGSMSSNLFQDVSKALNQSLVLLKEDPTKGFSFDSFDGITTKEAFALLLAAKQFTIIINRDRGPNPDFEIYRYPPNRPVMIGSGAGMMVQNAEFQELADRPKIDDLLSNISLRDPLTGCDWRKIDITNMGEF